MIKQLYINQFPDPGNQAEDKTGKEKLVINKSAFILLPTVYQFMGVMFCWTDTGS